VPIPSCCLMVIATRTLRAVEDPQGADHVTFLVWPRPPASQPSLRMGKLARLPQICGAIEEQFSRHRRREILLPPYDKNQANRRLDFRLFLSSANIGPSEKEYHFQSFRGNPGYKKQKNVNFSGAPLAEFRP
jgi:hypothetical protein